MATYSLGCRDCSGNSIPESQNLPMGPVRNRIFDPSTDAHFTTTIDLPYHITIADHAKGLTFLRYGDLYKPTHGEEKANRVLANKTGVQGAKNFLQITLCNTIVVQVASRSRHGQVIGARFFANKSSYNRTGMPDHRDSITRAVYATTDIGCQNCQDIVKQIPTINRVIFMTSSDELIDGAVNIWQYASNGFPAILPAGLEKEDYYMLHHNIKNLEACNAGVQVLFWKVKQEYLAGAVFDVNCRFDDLNNVPLPEDDASCYCFNCMVSNQSREKKFAETGKEPCPCKPCRALVLKYGHLKKGDTFPLTNNADVDAKVTMEVDGINSNANANGSVVSVPDHHGNQR